LSLSIIITVVAIAVKPARIESPKVRSLSSRSLFVEWQESHSEKLVSFQFTYWPEWDDNATEVGAGNSVRHDKVFSSTVF
jgi:hypothetical protein